MPGPTATVEYGSDGVAIVCLQNPPVNALHPAGARTASSCHAQALPAGAPSFAQPAEPLFASWVPSVCTAETSWGCQPSAGPK
jgi:hypothetical protein